MTNNKKMTEVFEAFRAKRLDGQSREEFLMTAGTKEFVCEIKGIAQEQIPEDASFTEKTFRQVAKWFETELPAKLANKILRDDLHIDERYVGMNKLPEIEELIQILVTAAWEAFLTRYVPCANEKPTAYLGEVMSRKYIDIYRKTCNCKQRSLFRECNVADDGDLYDEPTCTSLQLEEALQRNSSALPFDEVIARKDALQRALTKLDPVERKVVLLWSNGKNQTEIGKTLFCTQSAVSRIFNGAITVLRAEMAA